MSKSFGMEMLILLYIQRSLPIEAFCEMEICTNLVVWKVLTSQ